MTTLTTFDSNERRARRENRRIRVLLAEDDRAMREMIAGSLRRRGYEVLEARSGIDLLDLVEMGLEEGDLPFRPTIVVSDIRMRHLDGLRALDALRALGINIPVILISAFADDDTRRLAASLGAETVLAKPFDLDFLADAVAGAIRREPIAAPADQPAAAALASGHFA